MKTSFISHRSIVAGEDVKGKEIRSGIFDLIKSVHPNFGEDDYISLAELNQFRRMFLTTLALQEKGELAAIDKDVMDAIQNNSILSESIRDEKNLPLTFGQKLADGIASFGGSWVFIIIFFHLSIYLDGN